MSWPSTCISKFNSAACSIETITTLHYSKQSFDKLLNQSHNNLQNVIITFGARSSNTNGTYYWASNNTPKGNYQSLIFYICLYICHNQWSVGPHSRVHIKLRNHLFDHDKTLNNLNCYIILHQKFEQSKLTFSFCTNTSNVRRPAGPLVKIISAK